MKSRLRGSLALLTLTGAVFVASDAMANTLTTNLSWTIDRAGTSTKYRVAAYGDSIYAGWYGSISRVAKRAAPGVDGEYLQKLWNSDIEVIRRAKSGAIASDIYNNKIVSERSYMQTSNTRVVTFEMCGNDFLQARSNFKGQSGTCNLGVITTALNNCTTYQQAAMQYINANASANTKLKVITNIYYPGYNADNVTGSCTVGWHLREIAGRTKVGLSGSVYTTSNELCYSVEGNWNQNLFVFLGLGYYRQEINISYYSQWYTGKGYSGALQASHDNENLFMLAEINYDHFSEEARSGSSFRLIDGITTTNDISLSGLLRLTRGKAFHLFTLTASLKAVGSDEILQRSYTVNKGTYSYDSLATVSWIENKHMVNDIGGGLRYAYLVTDGDRDIDLELGGAVEAGYFSTEHFPLQSYGYYNTFNLSGSLFAKKLFRPGRLLVTPGLDINYRMSLGSDIAYIVQPLSVPEMVYHDYFVSKANLLRASVSVRCEMPLSKNNFVKSLFLIPQGRWASAPGTEAGDLTGYMISALAGFTF